LRKLLISRADEALPTEIEAACSRILADREIHDSLAAFEEAGAPCRYHSLDVRDTQAFGELIDSLYTEHGRLDGVLHGAGVIEDKLLRHKSAESFDRVFDTKVKAAMTLAHKLREDVSFVVFFSSVSGAFGNRGQCDYAAANEALDKIALSLNERVQGRVVSINWGPWAGAGMVSDDLEREYARRGIGLIEPAGGVSSFVDELMGHDGDCAQVILMRAIPSSLQ
jgi:NAD(P)-dependent dehydrogenase (short-subunit alcohol dehydrogenase family)